MIKTPEEMAKGKLLKKIMMYTLFGMIIIIIGDFSFSVITGNIYNFFSSGFGIIVFGAVWVNYYITFKKPLLHLRYSIFNFVATSLITITVLTYIVGGFSGAMISSFFIAIVVYSLLLNKKESMILSLLIITIYLVFYFGEFTGLIIPLTNCSLANNTCKAAIDIFSFMVVALFGTIISENANNSIKYYRLRSVRLGSIRKRLEFLVKRRTKELEQSNKNLKKAQSELRKNYKELKKLDVEKDNFISIAAHELKTPLTAIGGYAQLLKNDKMVSNSKKRHQFLDILEDESKRLSILVTDILNLSRLDLGVMRYFIEDVNIYSLIKNIENEFKPKLKSCKLKNEFIVQKGIPTIKTDKNKLHEILTNFLSNAIKYTPKGKITVKVERDGSFVKFSVEDTGIGIARKDYKKIFKRFSQIDSSLTRKHKGTGLGLSICKEFVTDLGGKIWFKSKAGKGTTFYFKLPFVSKVNNSLTKQ